MSGARVRGIWGFVCIVVAVGTAHSQDERPTGLDALTVPDGFTVEIAATPVLTAYPMFMAFDDRGRLFIAESSGKDLSGKEMVAAPECTILMLEDTDSDSHFDTRTIFADSLSLPMGVLWHQNSLYVASPPDFIRFTDTDDDGVADKREVLLTGWNILNTASLHGPFLGPDGWLYLTHGRHGYDITTKEGRHLEGLASRIWRCRPDGTQLERMAGGGFDNPVEIAFMDNGESVGTMTYFTDPKNGQRDALMHWVEGGVYPKYHESTEEFVRTGDLMPVLTKFARIAPAGLERYRGDGFGSDYKDNLFSAQFNPHRVQRHILTRTGATYACEDEDFVVSSDPDFHPTDIVQDADGSLLVCDTGAWYVDACPISRVARPEIRGAVYRIRRADMPAPTDGRGTSIDWSGASADELAGLLNDPRPKVSDRAVETLVARGHDAAPALEAALHAFDAQTRLNAVWALGRVLWPKSNAALRQALADADPAVRTAAARMVGLANDADAAPLLVALLHDRDAGVRRQAATALGQIGTAQAGPALLAACAKAADRYEEHALIFAAIMTHAEAPATAALASSQANVRKGALIALDQMSSRTLSADTVLPFLASESDDLRNAGLWVASHHNEWSNEVLSFVEARLTEGPVEDKQQAALHDVLLAYAAQPEMQSLVAKLLDTESLPEANGLLLMGVMSETSTPEFPESWVEALRHQAAGPRESLRWEAIDVIGTRNVAVLDGDMLALAERSAEAPGLRLAALSAAAPRLEALPGSTETFLLSQLDENVDPTLRLEAARILANSHLSNETLRELAAQVVPEADALTFPTLLNAFRSTRDEDVGLALVSGLEHAKVNPGMVPGGLDAVLEGFPESVHAAAAPMKAQMEVEAAERIERLKKLEPLLGKGDVGRGRQVFFGTKANCYTCHAVGKEGGHLGPDLTTIGEVRSGHDLLEAVLFPSASFVPGYEPYRIKTWDNIYEGVVLRQDKDSVLLAVSVDSQVRIPRDDIMEMKLGGVSIMPEGLDTAMTQDEFIDLITFLQSLNNEVWLLPEQRDQ